MRNWLALALLRLAVRLLRGHQVTVDFGGAHGTTSTSYPVSTWTANTTTSSGHVHWGS